MSGFGFGFGPSSPGEGGDWNDLVGKMPLFAEMQRMLSGTGGPVNWDLARQVAISGLAATHRKVTADDHAAIADAIRLADLWLDDVTDFPSATTTVVAWSQVDWVEQTIHTWATLCDPIAERVVGSMSSAMPPEVLAQAGPMAGMLSQFGGLMFGAQLGQGLASLAAEVTNSTEIGLPLGPAHTSALVVANVEEFANGINRRIEDVRLFIALREAAHQRLFASAGWLRQQVVSAIDAYARGIHIDADAITSALSDIDPTNPQAMQNALSTGLFEPQNTEAQNVALRRLETLLALIEGWVDAVVSAATRDRMSGSAALAEAIRRQRASGGPAEQTFATLVGLELRPRRLRDAAALWDAVRLDHGQTARDALWAHPDLLPSADDLDDPAGFSVRLQSSADFSVADISAAPQHRDAGPEAASPPKSEPEGLSRHADSSTGAGGSASNADPGEPCADTEHEDNPGS